MRNILYVCLILMAPCLAWSQCMGTNAVGSGMSTNNTNVAQSFVINCLGDGTFSSITVLNQGNATEVTLTIREGNNPNGTVRYTQTGVQLNVLAPTNNIITLQGGTGTLNFQAGSTYTFRLDADAPLQLTKNPGNPYSAGRLYEGGNPSGDLFFIVAGTIGGLPVDLSSFEAYRSQRYTALNWQTESEINNQGFELQRSRDAQNWKVIGFIEGQGRAASYTFTDKEPLSSGIYYYRLRQVDWDGQFEFSKVLVVKVEGISEPELLIYPNPVKRGQHLSISATSSKSGICLRLVSALGEVIYESTADQFYIPTFIPPGIYYLQQCGEAGYLQRLVVH